MSAYFGNFFSDSAAIPSKIPFVCTQNLTFSNSSEVLKQFLAFVETFHSLISKLFIENYRSIQKAELPLGKINVLTGANNSGKPSVLYAALTLKNLVSNPNRSLDAILTLPFINLGGFEHIVHLKKDEKNIAVGCIK